MNQKYIHLFFLIRLFVLSGLILFSGCGEEQLPITTNSAVWGYATDKWNNGMDIEVIAIGPYGEVSTIAGDEDGYFMIGGLGNGTYELEYEKEEYGTCKKFGIQLFGNDTVYAGRIELFQKYDSLVAPNLIEVKGHNQLDGLDNEDIAILAGIVKSREMPPLRIFVGKNDKVGSEDYLFTLKGHSLKNPEFLQQFIRLYDFYLFPLESGQVVYLIAYVCNYSDPGYLNPYTGLKTYPTVDRDSKSNVLEYIIP